MAESIKKVVDCNIEFIKSSGGRFEVFDGDRPVFSKAGEGRFPDTDEVLSRLR